MIREYTAFFPCCGSGGAAIGAAKAISEFKGHVGKFRVVGGIDVDPEACEDFENLTGAPAHCMDLFSQDDYVAFHGRRPPEEWTEVRPADIYRLLVGRRPDVVFISAPCQGNSGLLPEASAKTEKYQALNNLAYHSVWLMVEAFRDDPVPVYLFENVPRITTRSAHLLNRIRMMLKAHGYETHPIKDKDGYHDCGEVGGLGQHRKRYMMIARHKERCSAIIYRPPRYKLKTIGDVLGPLPMPDDPAAGLMHVSPRLTWKTLVRLALIPQGGDWRYLPLAGAYCIEHVPRGGVYEVADWNKPARAILGHARPGGSNGVAAVGDPRLNLAAGAHRSIFRIVPWEQTAPTVTGALGVNNGALATADPRIPEWRNGWKCSGAIGRVNRWDLPSIVLGNSGPRGYGAANVADPRLGCTPRNGCYKVQAWDKAANTITANGDIHAGSSAVADPRIPLDHERPDPPPIIIALDGTWHRPLTIYENAALQSFPLVMPDGRPLKLAGNSSARWRKRIGNAVPPDSAQAWFEMVGMSLMASEQNDWFLSSTGIWVEGESNDQGERMICQN